jgi:hypothetical protein
VTRIGPSVYLVRLPVTKVLRNVGTAIVILVGFFSEADQAFINTTKSPRQVHPARFQG